MQFPTPTPNLFLQQCVVLIGETMATTSNEQQWKGRRRLSLASNFGSRHDLYHTLFGRRQQVIATQLFFEDEAPTISQLKIVADTLGKRFERLRGIPTALEPDANSKNGTRVFRDVNMIGLRRYIS